jgi:hypothetical protein
VRAFDAPIHIEPRDPDAYAAKALRCTCEASPWCSGPGGAHWITCSRQCAYCRPPRRRRHRREAAEHPRGERDA